MAVVAIGEEHPSWDIPVYCRCGFQLTTDYSPVRFTINAKAHIADMPDSCIQHLSLRISELEAQNG